jgi:hypothetical protein
VHDGGDVEVLLELNPDLGCVSKNRDSVHVAGVCPLLELILAGNAAVVVFGDDLDGLETSFAERILS